MSALQKLRKEYEAWVAGGGDIHEYYFFGYEGLGGVLEAVQDLLRESGERSDNDE